MLEKVQFGYRRWLAILSVVIAPLAATAQEKQPNIVIIWGDDVGQSNVSAYSNRSKGSGLFDRLFG